MWCNCRVDEIYDFFKLVLKCSLKIRYYIFIRNYKFFRFINNLFIGFGGSCLGVFILNDIVKLFFFFVLGIVRCELRELCWIEDFRFEVYVLGFFYFCGLVFCSSF